VSGTRSAKKYDWHVPLKNGNNHDVVKVSVRLEALRSSVKLVELEDEEKKLRKVENLVESKLDEYLDLQKKRKCPTCDRPVNVGDFRGIVKKKELELEKASKAAEKASTELKEARALQKRQAK